MILPRTGGAPVPPLLLCLLRGLSLVFTGFPSRSKTSLREM